MNVTCGSALSGICRFWANVAYEFDLHLTYFLGTLFDRCPLGILRNPTLYETHEKKVNPWNSPQKSGILRSDDPNLHSDLFFRDKKRFKRSKRSHEPAYYSSQLLLGQQFSK